MVILGYQWTFTQYSCLFRLQIFISVITPSVMLALIYRHPLSDRFAGWSEIPVVPSGCGSPSKRWNRKFRPRSANLIGSGAARHHRGGRGGGGWQTCYAMVLADLAWPNAAVKPDMARRSLGGGEIIIPSGWGEVVITSRQSKPAGTTNVVNIGGL